MKIKFRVWDKVSKLFTDDPLYPDNQRFTEKFLINQAGELILLSENYLKGDKRFIYTVWTGLRDSKRREIYEGDIIKDREGRIERVHFKDGVFWVFAPLYEENVTVVGNIFENSELLEK